MMETFHTWATQIPVVVIRFFGASIFFFPVFGIVSEARRKKDPHVD